MDFHNEVQIPLVLSLFALPSSPPFFLCFVALRPKRRGCAHSIRRSVMCIVFWSNADPLYSSSLSLPDSLARHYRATQQIRQSRPFEGGGTRRTVSAICPCGPCHPGSSIIKIIPATYINTWTWQMLKGVKCKLKGFVRIQKHAHTPESSPFYLAVTHLPRGARCNGERGLPKVRIGDCDEEPDATCQVWRDVP